MTTEPWFGWRERMVRIRKTAPGHPGLTVGVGLLDEVDGPIGHERGRVHLVAELGRVHLPPVFAASG